MPGGDRTGPMGAGPMTGRAAGFCAGYAMPGHMNPTGGRGQGFWGRGCGGGWGRGRGVGLGASRFNWAPTPEQELESLKQQASYIQGALADITRRIEELAAQTPTK
jgi:hypothetical protein